MAKDDGSPSAFTRRPRLKPTLMTKARSLPALGMGAACEHHGPTLVLQGEREPVPPLAPVVQQCSAWRCVSHGTMGILVSVGEFLRALARDSPRPLVLDIRGRKAMSTRQLCMQFPLRNGSYLAQVVIPSDMTKAEA